VTDVTLILPTYNEREAVRLLHPRLQAALRPYDAEIVVVDDASPDGTGALVQSLVGERPYRLVERAGRLGLASAVLEGFERATGAVIVVMDADGSHPPEILPQLIEPVKAGRAEFAIASRKLPGGSAPGLSAGRRIISFIGGGLAWPLAPVSDPMSGFFAFHRSILGRAPLEPVGFKIALEVLVKDHPHPVAEVPFCFESRVAGTSKLDRAEIGGFLRHLGRLYAWRIGLSFRAESTR
jgi:dolichol-phosphate mannosyltransferase